MSQSQERLNEQYDDLHKHAKALYERLDRYREALRDIATRLTVERNPDGDDQAAYTMQLIAREALGEVDKETG